jgi:hypothetical protein
MKITQSQLRKIIKEELNAAAQKQLKAMLDQGLITPEEYKEQLAGAPKGADVLKGPTAANPLAGATQSKKH